MAIGGKCSLFQYFVSLCGLGEGHDHLSFATAHLAPSLQTTAFVVDLACHGKSFQCARQSGSAIASWYAQPKLVLRKSEGMGEPLDALTKREYQSLIGGVNYLACCMRPDIA